MFFNDENFGLLTHADLDGVGCYILIKDFLNDKLIWVCPTGYKSIEKNIKKISKKTKNILLTDLCLDQKYIDSIDKIFDNKFMIDHHQSSFERNIPFKSKINIEASGTLLTLHWLMKQGYKPSNDMKRFVKYVNDFDLWIHNHYESRILNNIYWELNFFDFYDEFKNGIGNNFKESEIYKIGLSIEEKKKNVILAADNWNINDKFRIVVIDKYISDVQFHYNEPYIIIVQDKKLSFRSTESLIDFYIELSNNGYECGGHKFAGGVVYNSDEDLFEIIELVVNFFEEE